MHRLSNKNTDIMTATCAECGDNTPISFRKDRGIYRCAIKIKEDSNKQYAKRVFGISNYEEVVSELLSNQDGRCAICRNEFGESKPHLDHCHESGRIRGLLCFGCNVGIGQFKDSVDSLMSAASYLLQFE